MDRFSEQLMAKIPDTPDKIKRAAVIAGEALVLALLTLITLWSAYTLAFFSLAAAAGSLWLFKYLWEATCIEYEYIVTNDDLDIDKIIGRRKRKRMVTVSLRTVTELAPYLNDTDVPADVTVVAHDNTGENLWYLLADTEKYGKLMVLFSANETTRRNIADGTETKVRLRLAAELGFKTNNENDPE